MSLRGECQTPGWLRVLKECCERFMSSLKTNLNLEMTVFRHHSTVSLDKRPVESTRQENRIAQRNYSKKLRRRLEDLESFQSHGNRLGSHFQMNRLSWLLAIPIVSANATDTGPPSSHTNISNEWPFIIACLAILLLSSIFAVMRISQARISGTMMALMSFIWWNAKTDPRTSQTVQWTEFAMGMIYTVWFGYIKFRKSRLDSGYVPLTIFSALILDFSAMALVQTQTSTMSQEGLLGFFLPCLSGSVFLVAYLVPLGIEHIPRLRRLRLRLTADRPTLPL